MILGEEEQRLLVAGIRAGRSDAFENLYAALHEALFNLAARLVGDREEAKDIVQEVFLEACRRLTSYQDDLRLEAWMYRVTMNRSFDHLRRRRLRAAEPLPEADALPAACDPHEQAATAALVETALLNMSDRHRAALVLKELHGLSGRDLAAALGTSRAAADVLLFRARNAFKRAYLALGGEQPAVAASRGHGLAVVVPWLLAPADLLHPTVAEAAAGASGSVTPAVGGLLAHLGGSLGAKVAATVTVAAALSGGVLLMEQRSSAPPLAAAAEVVAFTPDATAGATPTAGATAPLGWRALLVQEQHRVRFARCAMVAMAGQAAGGRSSQSAGSAATGSHFRAVISSGNGASTPSDGLPAVQGSDDPAAQASLGTGRGGAEILEIGPSGARGGAPQGQSASGGHGGS
jgi:RNA polymerase sigma-70 factor (ECF subfamily)